jgi:hypothetical protein
VGDLAGLLDSPDAINVAYREAYAEQQTIYGRFGVPKEVERDLGEQLRQAFVRLTPTQRSLGHDGVVPSGPTFEERMDMVGQWSRTAKPGLRTLGQIVAESGQSLAVVQAVIARTAGVFARRDGRYAPIAGDTGVVAPVVTSPAPVAVQAAAEGLAAFTGHTVQPLPW